MNTIKIPSIDRDPRHSPLPIIMFKDKADSYNVFERRDTWKKRCQAERRLRKKPNASPAMPRP